MNSLEIRLEGIQLLFLVCLFVQLKENFADYQFFTFWLFFLRVLFHRVFYKLLYQQPSPQKKKEAPRSENKLRLFLKRSSEPLLNMQNQPSKPSVSITFTLNLLESTKKLLWSNSHAHLKKTFNTFSRNYLIHNKYNSSTFIYLQEYNCLNILQLGHYHLD